MVCNRVISFAASLLLGVTAFGWLSSSAHAAAITPFLAVPSGGTIRTDTFPQAGTGFAANPSGTAVVNALGYWDEGGDGLTTSEVVGLYHYNGSGEQLIAKATIPAGTAAYLENGYRWVNVPAVTLTDTDQTNTWYAIMSSEGPDPWTTDGITIANSSFGNFPASVGYYSTGAMPNVGDVVNFDGYGASHYGNGNIGFGTIPSVPEPSSIILMIGGVAAVWFCKKRRAV